MQNKIKRPVSVWIAQILFVYCVLMVILGFLLASRSVERSDISFFGVVFTLIWETIFIVLLVTAFWGMAARKSYGRWLGVGMLSFIVLFANVGKVLFPSNSAEPIVATIIRVIFSILVFAVILHISLSDKMEAFFARKAKAIPFDHPPPPPSFDT